MAVGGKRRNVESDDDEDVATPFVSLPSHLWVQPAENEPPEIQNHPQPIGSPFSRPALNFSNTDDPALDTQLIVLTSDATTDPAVSVDIDRATKGLPRLQFKKALKTQGLEEVEQEGDGNCLFRAISLQVYGQSDNHDEVRKQCMDFMAKNEEHYSNFVVDEDTTFQDYITRKRSNGVHGNNPEIQAMSELFNRPVEVYTPDNRAKPINIFHAEYKTSDPPIRLAYHDGNHYNAVIDPLVPTAGCGLGLPDLKPGLADKMQISKAKTESDHVADQMELQRVLNASKDEFNVSSDNELMRVLKESSVDFMYKKKGIDLSDLDETNFELEQNALANSLESYRRQDFGRKQRASPAGRRRQRSSQPKLDDDWMNSSIPTASSFASIPLAASANIAPASVPSAASLSSVSQFDSPPTSFLTEEEYPQTVQELVMNGFELTKVVHAYDLIGDNFDDLLAFLLSTSSTN